MINVDTHTARQQLIPGRPGDARKVLHKVTRGLKHSQDLLVGSGHKLEPPDRGETLHVVAVDLRP